MLSTKDKILRAVIDHIKDGDNLNQITVSKIADEAKIGKSTVYEHFSSKEEMILETYKYLLVHYEQILISDLECMDFKGAFIEQIKKILGVMKDAKTIMNAIMNNHQDVFLNFGLEVEQCAKSIQNQMTTRFKDILYLGVIEGVILQREPKAHEQNVIQAIISGLLYQYVNQTMDIDEDALCELIYEQTMAVIKR